MTTAPAETSPDHPTAVDQPSLGEPPAKVGNFMVLQSETVPPEMRQLLRPVGDGFLTAEKARAALRRLVKANDPPEGTVYHVVRRIGDPIVVQTTQKKVLNI